ncbi:hypothetical protein BH11PLA2_BH11PLA2_34810 [soil metagenome]
MLADPSRSLYLILIVAVIVAAAVWVKQRNRTSLTTLAVMALLLLVITLSDHFIESPREEAKRRVEAMAAAAQAGSPTAFLDHVSARFDKNGRGRDALRTSGLWPIINQYKPEIKVWDFSREEYRMLSDNELEIGFMTKGEAQGGFLLRYSRAMFIKDSDGAWRLKSIAFYNPAENGMKNEDPIPGFP